MAQCTSMQACRSTLALASRAPLARANVADISPKQFAFVRGTPAVGLQRRSSVCRAVRPDFKEAVDKFLDEHKVTAFIKGTRDFPQCGFSNTVVQILNRMEVPYETVDILADEGLRSGMKEYSEWPTFPQIYIDGEFYGGCDIMLEAYSDGSLKEELEKVMLS